MKWSDLERRGPLNAQGLKSDITCSFISHTLHTHAAMLKKKKNEESSVPCVKKVRLQGRMD